MAGPAKPSASQRRADERTPAQTTPGAPTVAAEPTPGLDAAKAVDAHDDAAAVQVSGLLRRYPQERDEILTWAQQHRGNQFAQLVRSKLGTVEAAMPEGFALESVRASATIPGHKKLSGSWKATVATGQATRVTAEVTPTGIRVSLSPGLHVDATWPLQNADVHSAGIDFATGQSFTNITDGHGIGSGMFSITGNLDEMITDALDKGVAGTPLAKPGYEPTQDPNLSATLAKVVASFQHLATSDSQANEADQKSPIAPTEVDQVSVGATVNAKLGGSFLKDGNGLVIAPGSTLSVDVDGDGNMGDLSKTKDAGSAVEAAKLRAVRITAGDLVVQAKGKPVARITALTIHPGGHVTIERMELLDQLAKAKDTEGGLALLVAIIALHSGRPDVANGAANYAQDPQLVDGVARKMIEDQFTKSVMEMVIANRHAVPGVDLAAALKIG